MTEPVVETSGLSKTYLDDGVEVHALHDVDLRVEPGTLLAVVGPSGSGKSTLLHLLGTLDEPTSGSVRVEGVAVERLGERERTHLRRRRIGFVFQSFNLLPTLTALENVMLPGLVAGQDRRASRRRAETLLRRIGLDHCSARLSGKLSGGEQQRVAVARALFHQPAVVLADEPTGNLDTENGDLVLDALRAEVDSGQTVVLASHDPRATGRSDRALLLRDGRCAGERPRHEIADLALKIGT